MSEDAEAEGTVAGAAVEPDGGAVAAAEAAALDLDARVAADPRDRGELLAELERAEAQRDEYLDDLRRAHADFENYRKRVVRDGAVQRDQGRADAVGALLDVLDDLDRVVAAASSLATDELGADVAAVASGVGVVAEKAQRALAGVGVERVDAVGVPFDPPVHDAVQQVEREAVTAEGSAADATGEGDAGPTVHQMLRPGYRLAERVLRPAMVVVAQ